MARTERASQPATAAEAAWTLTEAANEPFFTLVQRYVFPPFFVGTVAAGAGGADAAALWGYATAAAGLLVALFAPIMGAAGDAGGRRRPFLLATAAVAFAAALLLWFAEPGRPLALVLPSAVVALAAFELLAVVTNGFLPITVGARRFGLASGLAFAFGQLTGIASLLAVIHLSQSPPALLLGVAHGVDRLAGPLSALALLLFLTPALLLLRDPPGRPAALTLGRTGATLLAAIREAWADPTLRFFYLGRMIGGDGLALIFAFGGVLAGQTFGWTASTLAGFGIAVTLASAAGGFAAALADRRLGPRRTVMAGFTLVLVGLAGLLGAGAGTVFGWATGALPGGPLASPQERLFLAGSMLVALGAGPAIAGMRALMATIAPPGRASACFGLYAFVGKATNFLGPLLAGLVITATGSVRLGLAVALAFLLLGIACFALMPLDSKRKLGSIG